MQTITKINQLVTFQLEEDIFGIDIMLTQEILKLDKLRKIPNSPYFFEGMLNLRGDVIPIVNFKKLFSFGTFDLSRDKSIIIIKISGERFGIVIDKVLRVIPLESEVQIKPVPQGFSQALKKYIQGVIENQGEYIALLDIQTIFKNTKEELTLGGEVGQYNLNFIRDKLYTLDVEDDKAINKFLSSISFKTNIVTDAGIRFYFARQKIRQNIPISKITQKLKKSIDENIYNPFNQSDTNLFYNLEEDYNALLDIIENLILPKKLKENNNSLKIINIGCGSGQELYSILFIFQVYFPTLEKWSIKLIGVDDNLNHLNAAKQGIYPEENLVKISKKDIKQFFEHKEKNYHVKDFLRNMVDFRFGTAKNFDIIKGVDLFFCRGIFSSMEKESIQRLLSSMTESLIPGGVILLSEIEDIYYIDNNDLYPREINGHRYYIRS